MLLAKITIIITRNDLCSSELMLNMFSCISLVLQGCMDQIRFKHRNFQRNLAPIKILTVKKANAWFNSSNDKFIKHKKYYKFWGRCY